jgi:hypothetical protein
MISASFTYDGAHLFRPREQVLSLVGATGSSTVTFLLPGTFPEPSQNLPRTGSSTVTFLLPGTFPEPSQNLPRTGSSTVTFLLPGFAAMKLFKARRPGLARLGAVQLALGCILMPISLLLIILGKASH